MKASVIVLSWNGMEYLGDCLNAVLSQEYPDCEIIVVDNGSSDGSADFVEQRYPQVRLIRNERNLGFAGGCNVGLRAATGDMLILLNQDTRVCAGWLRALGEALEDPKIGVAGCKILYPDGETVQHAGGWIEWPLGSAHHYRCGEQDDDELEEPRQVEYVTGAAMAVRRDVVETVGYLDEEFWPGYFEDADFCVRAEKAGFEVWFAPEAVLTHVESASHTDEAWMWEAHHRGRMRFVLKHTPPDELLTRFVPAEEDHQRSLLGVLGARPLRIGYLEAMCRAPLVLCRYWQAEEETIKEVVRSFQHLYALVVEQQRPSSGRTGEVTDPPAPALGCGDTDSTEVMADPRLEDFEFRSDVPVLGPLVGWLRAGWYAIAAKWGVRHLAEQQEAINRHHTSRQNALQQRVTRLSDENVLLARENALLASQIVGLTLDLRDRVGTSRAHLGDATGGSGEKDS